MSANAGSISSASIVAEVIDNGTVSGQQLLVVGLCLFFNMLDGFDITAMAIVGNAVLTELEITPDRMGLIFSAALAGMMIGAMLLAPMSDLIGRRAMIIISVALVGGSILLTANATSLAEFLVLRLVSGMGAGAMLACQAALAAEYSPDKYKTLAVAAVTSGYPLGAMMTSVVAGFILPDYGWRGMFWFGGALTTSMAIVAIIFIPESLKYLLEKRPENALNRINKILSKLKKNALHEMPEFAAPTHQPRGGLGRTMLKLLSKEHRVATLTLWTAFFLCFSTLYFLMSWIPILVENSGYEPAAGRKSFFLFNLGGVLGIYLIGWLSTRWKLTNLIFILSLSSAVSMAIFALAPNQLNLLYSLIFLIGILQQGGFTGLYGVAAKVYPTEIRSTGIGWAIGLGRLGAVASPFVAGYLIAAGFGMSANFFFFAIPMAVGGAIAYRLNIR